MTPERAWSAITRKRTSSIVVGAVAAAGELLGAADHRADQVGLVDGSTPCSRVATRSTPIPVSMFLRGSTPIGGWSSFGLQLAPHVLHEDEVPDLEVAVLVRLRAAVAAVLGPAVVVDLRAGAAGAGNAHVPVVVLAAAALDPLGGDAGDLPPQVGGLVVVAVHGDPDPVRVEPVAALGLAAGDQLPGVLDRALLEVVAEGEVARPSGRTCCAGWSGRPRRCRRCARTSGSTWPGGRAGGPRRGSTA